MKVLKRPDFSYTFTCEKCCCELEANGDDVIAKYLSPNQRADENACWTYYVVCCECSKKENIDYYIPYIPEAVKHLAESKR